MIGMIIGIGAGIAAVLIGTFSILTRHRSLRGGAEDLQATDPQLAAELRQIQADMDRGGRARSFY